MRRWRYGRKDKGKLICSAGFNANSRAISYDGVNWESKAINFYNDGIVQAYCNGFIYYDKPKDVFFIFTSNGYLAESKDGIITDRAVNLSKLDNPNNIDADFLFIRPSDSTSIYDNYIFICKSSHNKVYMIKRNGLSLYDTIMDLSSWELLDLPLTFYDTLNKKSNGINYQKPILGDNGLLLIPSNSNNSNAYYCKMSDMKFNIIEQLSRVIYGCFFNGIFIVSSGSSKTLLYSDDCVNWKETNFTINSSLSNTLYIKFKVLGDRLYAIATSVGYIAYSYDGINWTELINVASSVTIYDMIYFNKKYIAVCSGSNGNIYYSTDGENFSIGPKLNSVGGTCFFASTK